MPSNSDSAPIGHWIAVALTPNLALIDSTLAAKSAPILSILFEKTSLGTPISVAWRQTFSVWGSTPFCESSTVTAPSNTLSDLVTSIVKSTWPGVSIIFKRLPFQNAVVAAEVMVIPRSFSCSIQSICDSPSWVSPILWILWVWNKTRSVTVVLPASTWAIIPMLRVFSNEYSRAIY